uniref:Glycosyltransferase RgtA/B/C/D-like domain-containing protein n=1 Tax=uncultured marine thaumarchaeote KM3_89_C12 TaxID=1456339 RepID=A0A075HVD9_9ARCH|nr:hypothetical protein [uncultured marine thaumarchaeote KM3_89_C12]
MEVTIQLSRSRVILYLILICVISLGLKLYIVDFSIPPHTDDIAYVQDAIQYNEGDFFLSPKRSPGWSLFISPFMSVVNSNDFLDYSNFARLLTLTISTVTIFPMYILARKFFNEKYSVIAASLFAFEPHLNYNSGSALSEPLLILVLIITMVFILQNKTKYLCLAFIFAGLCWWIRLEAFYSIIAIILIYFVVHRTKSNSLRNFSLCMIFLLIILSPLFIQRYVQFDDPFYIYYGEKIFVDDYAGIFTDKNSGVINLIENDGILGLIDKLANGLANLFNVLFRILYPYLFILIPFGVWFSLRPIDQKLKNIKANWIMIIVTISILIIPFAIVDERRYLFVLFPFLIILATIPIQRVTNYGLNTFSFNERQKSAFLVIIVGAVFVLSSTFTMGVGEFGYGLPNSALEFEKVKFTEHLVENFDGRILKDEVVIDYLSYVNLTSSDNADFKTIKSPRGKDPYIDLYESGKVVQIFVNGKTVEELVTNGQARGLKYIGILETGSYFFPFLNDIYYNEENYPYMKKVFDSQEVDYEEFKIKVFEIDYKKFHELDD